MLSGGLPESLDIGVRGSGEEEQFVEIALAEEFRFALRQSGVLGEFARRKIAQRHDFDAWSLQRPDPAFLPRPAAEMPLGCT